MNARLAYLLSTSKVTLAPAGSVCDECEGFALLRDLEKPARKVSAAKYLVGSVAVCGSHVLRLAEDREVRWNGKAYVAISAGRKPAAKNPGHVRVPNAPTVCSGHKYGTMRRLCSDHGGSFREGSATCTTYARKVAERNTALALRAQGGN